MNRPSSYIGSTLLAINSGEVPLQRARRIMGFPMLVCGLFIELLGQGQPQALVIPAHFFPLMVGSTEIWWIGHTGRRDVRGIQSIIPAHWKDLIKWPDQLADKAWMFRADMLWDIIGESVEAFYTL